MKRIKTHVKKGETVEVISGNYRGSTGKILQVIPGKGQVLIEGVRMVKKHLRKSQDRPNGEIVAREGPIHISNVRLVQEGEPRSERPGKSRGEKMQ